MLMEDILNEIQECEPVQLEPFAHQVGGHSSILCLDERTVCKPLIKQELKFYETLPNSMKKFTPEYRGIIQVRFQEDTDGYISAVAAYPPKSFRYQISNSSKKRQKGSRRIKLKNSGSIEIEIESDLSELFVDEDVTSSKSGTNTSPSSNKSSSVRPINSWSLKCHRDHLSKIRRNVHKEKEPPTQKFMVLENLTWRFEYPCILDLKMGTRQYGDDATPAKIESQTAKASQSTSTVLGVRVCGMQVYEQTTGRFKCRNKYYGRKLDAEGFREALYYFLHNGKRLRTDAIIPLLEKLRELKSTLASSSLDTFRFYTSSLLLIYEGLDPELSGDDEAHSEELEMDSSPSPSSTIQIDEETENSPTPTPMDLDLIAPLTTTPVVKSSVTDLNININISTTTTTGSSKREGVVSSGLKLDQLSPTITTSQILNLPHAHAALPKSEESSSENENVLLEATNKVSNSKQQQQQLDEVVGLSLSSPTTPTDENSSSGSSFSNGSRSNLCSRGSTPSAASLTSESVDVRLIDFAHATHSGLEIEGALVHSGPDAGFIFGLSNLIKVLQEIMEAECSS